MSIKHCIIVSSISVENGFKPQTTQSAKTLPASVKNDIVETMKFMIIFILTSVTLFAQSGSTNTEKRMFGRDWLRLQDNNWEINVNLDSLKIGDTLRLTQSVKTNLNTYRFIRHAWKVQFVASIGKRPKWRQKASWFALGNYLEIHAYPFHPRITKKYKLINDSGDKINFVCVEILKEQT